MRFPLTSSRLPRLWMEMSVLGCRPPSVSRFTFSAIRNSGSAATKSPLAFNSEPRLVMQRAEAIDGEERAPMPITEGLAPHHQRLAEQRLSLLELALGLQLRGKRIQGGKYAPTICALGLEPCAQKLEAQRVAVLVHALTAAVGRVLLWARAPPLLEAVLVDPLGGAAASTWLHERAILFTPPAKPAHLLLLVVRSGTLVLSARSHAARKS
eukprot:scaffold16835_cov60-Phaeocystis_antarctica.AAC.2